VPGSSCQADALLRAVTRQLLWGLRGVSREVGFWNGWARRIPDQALRTDALAALERKRCNIDGAAFFWTLPRQRDPLLLRLLVAYEILADYLDRVNERDAHVGIVDGRQLHCAMSEALAPDCPISDYYRHHPHRDDGGYLQALVETCRGICVRLPSYWLVRPAVMRAASFTQVLAINHEPEGPRRNAALREWAAHEFPVNSDLVWFERCAAASAWLTVLALLVLASETDCTETDVARTYAAYLPWISLAGTMLDSYVDIAEDHANGDHSYIEHYSTLQVATQRLTELVRRAADEAQALPNADRHAVLVSCMTAMYLSKANVHQPAIGSGTAELVQAGGPLTKSLLPILRAFRLVNGQASF
jgi:tetraprenyl-beta-curcumene synthase